MSEIKFFKEDKVIPADIPKVIAGELLEHFKETSNCKHDVFVDRLMSDEELQEAKDKIADKAINELVELQDALSSADSVLASAKRLVKEAKENIDVFNRENSELVKSYNEGTKHEQYESDSIKSAFKANYIFYFGLINDSWHLLKFREASNEEIEKYSTPFDLKESENVTILKGEGRADKLASLVAQIDGKTNIAELSEKAEIIKFIDKFLPNTFILTDLEVSDIDFTNYTNVTVINCPEKKEEKNDTPFD